jgi:signal transduction histidine kinase
LVVFLFSHASSAGPAKEVRRVLILNEVGTYYPLTNLTDEGIRTGLENSPYRIEFYREYMDTVLFPDPPIQQQFREFFIHKYQNHKLDVIITVGPSPLSLMLQIHNTAFPGVPIVFCTINALPGDFKVEPEFTGVGGDISPASTIAAALRLQPRTKHVVVVGGLGAFDVQQQAAIKAQLGIYEDRLDSSYLTNLSMAALLDRLGHLSEDTVILLSSISQDAEGTRFTSSESGPLVVAAANAPVYSLSDRFIGHGEVGGDISSSLEQGKAAGGMALRLLNGEKPQNIPTITTATTYTFDWRALKHWGLRESDLPPGSTLLFKEISVWERTKWIWISGLLIILFLSALAAYLQFSRKQLRQARDAQLQLSGLLIDAQEMERSRLASELHDDFSQRLALLALGLENASEALPDSSQGAKRQLHELLNSASELGADLHTVSRRLHPSTLESLGLVTGLKALCEEFTSRQGIEVVFSAKNIPRAVSPNVALCLFRIVQEGLQNLRKYSGASQGKVDLRKGGDRLFLSLSDEGRGFDAKEMRNRVGLGIRSMGERARLVGGQFEILSEPGKGTRIDVCVPLYPENETVEELNMHRKADAL